MFNNIIEIFLYKLTKNLITHLYIFFIWHYNQISKKYSKLLEKSDRMCYNLFVSH